MLTIQYILLALIAVFIIRPIIALSKRKIHYMDFFFWLVFWSAVAAVVIWPQTAQIAANAIGIGRGADLVVYLGVMGLYFIFYQLLVKVKQLDHKLTTLGREVAIHNAVDCTEKKEEK